MRTKPKNENDLPYGILRNCRAVVFDRVVSERCGDAVLEKGCWHGVFVAASKLAISKRPCFLIRLDGETYVQTYVDFVDPKIRKTKWYVVDIDGHVDPQHYDTQSAARSACREGQVVKGKEILERPEDFHVTVVFT